jgi:hypothetical protein
MFDSKLLSVLLIGFGGLLTASGPFTVSAVGQQVGSDEPADRAAKPADNPSDASAEQPQRVTVALRPLFDQIRAAGSTRATVELTVDTVIDGAVVNSETSLYQIASTAPDRFTVYLKDAKQRTRLFSDGKRSTIAFSPKAYAHLAAPIPMQQAVFNLPVPMGPYPEPVLALTLAGVDPALTLTTGMKSIRVAGEEKFRGRTPSLRVTGVQDDAVQWDLWMTREQPPKPLRLRVDLTEMLRQNGDLELPAGYRYLLRFDFRVWLMDHQNDPKLYRYEPAEDATEYATIEEYVRSLQPADNADD